MREIKIWVKRFFDDRRLIRFLLKDLLIEIIVVNRRRLYFFVYFDSISKKHEWFIDN